MLCCARPSPEKDGAAAPPDPGPPLPPPTEEEPPPPPPRRAVSRVHEGPLQSISNDYDIDQEQVLGTGFAGAVFIGVNKITNEKVAVKTLAKKVAEDVAACGAVGGGTGGESAEEILAQVRSEAALYLSVDHPNIVRLRDTYETEDFLYLVCDCCTGGEIFDRLVNAGRFSEVDAAKTCKGMLSAVSYIHNSMHIVHRDIKLQNFLFPTPEAGGESVKLIDFGFSKHLSAPGGMRAVTAGTVEYMAPELLEIEDLKKRHSVVAYPADMWAMGVTLFMLLGGYPPFSGTGAVELMEAIRQHRIKWFKARWKNVGVSAESASSCVRRRYAHGAM